MIVRLATRAMGTRFEIVLAGEDEVRLRAAGEEAIEEIEEQDRRLSLFRRDSLVARINRTAHAAPVRLDADEFDLFADALAVREASDGAFDVNVAHAMRERGLHEDSMLGPPAADGGVPGRLVLDPADRSLSFTAPGAAVDLGGIAKGHALDLAAQVLRDVGVERALIHGGTSSAVAVGAPPDMTGWRVAVRGADSIPVVSLRDGALSVSARDGRQSPAGDPHVLDPRSGRPATGPAVVAVWGPSARRTDAWSTALLAGTDPTRLDASLSAAVHDGGPWRTHGPQRRLFALSPDPRPTPAPISP